MGCGKPQEVAQRGGCPNGSTRSTVGQNLNFFYKKKTLGLGPHGLPEQVFLARFELVVARFDSLKSQNAFKMGCYATKIRSKMGQK